MRKHRRRGEVADLVALSEHRGSMRALGRVTASARAGGKVPSSLAAVFDLDAERSRRRSNVLLLERRIDDPA